MDDNLLTNHNIILQGRKTINISGVKDCLGFDDETINLLTTHGKMTIKGNSLHITNFNTESGDLSAEGKFNAMVYTASDTEGGFFHKIFK